MIVMILNDADDRVVVVLGFCVDGHSGWTGCENP